MGRVAPTRHRQAKPGDERAPSADLPGCVCAFAAAGQTWSRRGGGEEVKWEEAESRRAAAADKDKAVEASCRPHASGSGARGSGADIRTTGKAAARAVPAKALAARAPGGAAKNEGDTFSLFVWQRQTQFTPLLTRCPRCSPRSPTLERPSMVSFLLALSVVSVHGH
jgi:hypothetical protein